MGSGKNGKNLILEGVLNAVTAIPPIAYLIIFIAAWGNSVFTMGGSSVGFPDASGHQTGSNTD